MYLVYTSLHQRSFQQVNTSNKCIDSFQWSCKLTDDDCIVHNKTNDERLSREHSFLSYVDHLYWRIYHLQHICSSDLKKQISKIWKLVYKWKYKKKQKMLIMNKFSFCHNVFKSILQQIRQHAFESRKVINHSRQEAIKKSHSFFFSRAL